MAEHPSQTTRTSQKAGKHVIILGAGASVTSGYPLGEGLRQLLASPDRLRQQVRDQLKEKDGDIERSLDYSLKGVEQSIRLFREGAFATVDEFIRLVPRRFGEEAGGSSLRSDIAVLSFNYDPYLEFLLRQAYQTRCNTKGPVPSDMDSVVDAILSGFGTRMTKELVQPGAFCLLKLHGTCALPSRDDRDDPCPTHEELFSPDPKMRFSTVSSVRFADIGFPPIYFPWEIISPKGSFVSKDKFRRADQRQTTSDVKLFPLFKAIWERARKEVQDAAKLSIVGLSMHDYLKPGLRFLLQGKRGQVDLVVADTKPQRPVNRLQHWLKEICPDLRWTTPIRVRQGFNDFIQEEMEPLPTRTETSGLSTH